MKEVEDVDAAKEANLLGERLGAPAETIKLSVSVAKEFIDHTPLHAYNKHRLLGGAVSEDTDATRDGKILEDLIFGLGKLAVIDADVYRTNEAKKARNDAVAEGKTPVLKVKYQEYADTAMAMAGRLKAAGVSLEGGSAQQILIWTVDGVECKGILDYLIIGPDFYIIYDLKCVVDASPRALQRAIFDYGWDMQHAAYVEAVETKYPHLAGRGKFKFLFCEKDAPNAVSVVSLGGMMRELGDHRWKRSRAIWKACLANNYWPGYPADEALDALPWMMATETFGE